LGEIQVVGFQGEVWRRPVWGYSIFEGQSDGSEVTIASLKREQWYIVVSEVAIVPLIGER